MAGGRPVGSKGTRAIKAQNSIIALLDGSMPAIVSKLEDMLNSGNNDKFKEAMEHIHKFAEFGLPKLARTEIAHEGEIETHHRISSDDREILAQLGIHVKNTD